MSEFADNNHAIFCGMVSGALAYLQGRLEALDPNEVFEVTPEIDENGDFTNRIFVERPSRRYVVIIEPEEE